MATKLRRNQRGFTLLEILVTIIISALLALILVQVMSNQTSRSYRPLQIYDERLSLESAMENITADHRHLMLTDADPLLTLSARVNGEDDFSGYWDSGSAVVVAENRCIADPIDTDPHDCEFNDTLLKITLSNGAQSLTALFTR